VRRANRLAIIIASFLAAAAARSARAAVDAPAQAIVRVHVAAADPVVEALRERLSARLAYHRVTLELGVSASVEVDRVLAGVADARASEALATVWIDGRAADAALLFLVPQGAQRVVARRIALATGFDSVALSEIAFVIERSVVSLLASQPIGVPMEEARLAFAQAARAGAPVAPAPAPPPSPVWFALALFVGSEAWSTAQTVVPALGLSALAERGAELRLGLQLGGRVQRSFAIDVPGARLRVGGGAVDIMVAVARSFGDLGIARLALGPGLAFSSVDAQVASEAESVQPRSRSDVDLTLGAAARWDLAFSRNLAAFAGVAVDASPVSARYTSVAAGRSSPLASPWPVRPTFFVGLALVGSR
jgi:hypothetical protein